MRNNKPLLILGSMLLAGVVVIASMVLFFGPLLEKKDVQSTDCKHTAIAHTATIQNGIVSPEHTQAKRCDTLTIVNNDTATRIMAFGQHEDHVAYDGILEKRLAPAEKFTVTLNQTGEYIFHDHLQDSVSGSFNVTK